MKKIFTVFIDDLYKNEDSKKYVRKIFKEYDEKLDTLHFRFDKTDNGKPYIKGSKYRFNVSHTKELIMCGISNYEIGCDIERGKSINIDIANRFFHENEYNLLKDITDIGKRDQYFIKLWTYKEAFIKCIGEGLKRPLNSFDLSGVFDKYKENIIKVKDITEQFATFTDRDEPKIYMENNIEYDFYDLDINEYKISICIKRV